jgi:glucose/mannose-6-phosphate isomerase
VSPGPRLDSAGMWDAASALPEQLSGALETARGVFGPSGAEDAAPPRAVVGIGVGTGAAACEAVAALTGPRLGVPFVVWRGGDLPAFVGPGSLVLAASCGAESPETVMAVRDALERGARVAGVGNDGELARLASSSGFAWCPVGTEGAAARTALGAATVSMLCALHAGGLVADCSPSVSAAAASLARRRDAYVAAGAGDRGAGTVRGLARRIGGTFPLVYGSSGVGAVAARWWKSCVNLDAKSPAFAAELPALAYDELAGWGQGGDITRQTTTLVLLRHAGEGASVDALFGAVRDATDEVMADVLEVWGEGDDDLGRFFDLALVGELVALELAARTGVDPGPVPAVDEAHVHQA